MKINIANVSLSSSQKGSNLRLKCARIHLAVALPDTLAAMRGILLREEGRVETEGKCRERREKREGRVGEGGFTSPEQGRHLSNAGTELD